MQRAITGLTFSIGGWFLMGILNLAVETKAASPPFEAFARIWFITIPLSIFWYVRAKKAYKTDNVERVSGIVKGLRENSFDLLSPLEFKRRYAIVAVKKKRYKCYEADGIPVGSKINCLKFNNTLVPEIGEVERKKKKHVEHNDT